MLSLLGRRSPPLLAPRTSGARSAAAAARCGASSANPPPTPRRGADAAPSSTSRRFLRATPRLAKTGFEALMPRDNRGGRRSEKASARTNPHFLEASSVPHPRGEADEDDWTEQMEDDRGGGGGLPGLDERNRGITDEHDFGERDPGSELRDWHARKEQEFHRLSTETEALLDSAAADEGHVLSRMREWNAFLSSVTSDINNLSDFRRQNPGYPPSDFMASVTRDAAEQNERLLDHLLDGGRAAPPPRAEAEAYALAMEAWSLAFHAHSGDRCEAVLERYGERFGGDMDHMPSLGAYKTVLRAHLKSCPSHFTSRGGGASPGERALGISNLLANVHAGGDMYLKPDVELHSLAAACARCTLLDWRGRRRLGHVDEGLERDLVGAVPGVAERASLALEEAKVADKKGGVRPSLEEWHLAIRAHADALAVVAKVPVGNDENIAEKWLTKLEHLVSSNAKDIASSAEYAGMDDAETQGRLSDIRRILEESYTSTLYARLILSKEGGSFNDFKAALDNAISSEVIVQGMRQRSQDAPPNMNFLFPFPTPDDYGALIECWCECVRKSYSTSEANAAMEQLEELPHLKAESLLEQLEIQQAARPIDGSIYMKVIWAWGQVLNWPAIYRQNQFNFAVDAADDLLKKTMHRYENGSVYFDRNPDVTKMYNSLFRIYSKIFNGGEIAMNRSLKLFDDMEHWRQRSEGAIAQPDAFTFGLILKTISNSGAPSAAANAEAILRRMEDCGVWPRERHYLGLVRAYARVGQMDVADPRKAEAVLHRVKEIYEANKSVKPTVAMYSACIAAYGGSKKFGSVSKVTELFEEVKRLYEETGDKDFQPDSMLYGEVLSAITKAKAKDASNIHQAMQLLEAMERSQDLGEIETGPNRYAYTNLINAIAQSRIADGPKLAEGLVLRMGERSKELNDKTILPDVHAYTTLIQVFANSGRSDAIQRAQKWFKQMENQYEDGDSRLKPNKVAYTALINCWRRSDHTDAGMEADKILSMMESKGKDGDLGLKPDAFVYASVIDTWARCNNVDKAVRAWNIYKRMAKQYSEGNMESRPNNVIVSKLPSGNGLFM